MQQGGNAHGEGRVGDDLVDLLCDFFVVMSHSVLRHRCVYPKELFEEVRHKSIKSMPVAMCRHPAVSLYLYNTISDLRPFISKGEIKKISLILKYEQTEVPVEAYDVEISPIFLNRGSQTPNPGETRERLMDAFKGMMVKLLYSFPLMIPITKPLTFSIVGFGTANEIEGKHDEWVEVGEDASLPPQQTTLTKVKSSRVNDSDGKTFSLLLLAKENKSAKS